VRRAVAAAAVVVASAALLAARPAEPRFVVVVNAANPIASLPREQLARLFLRKVKRWPNGTLAEPVDLAPDDPTRAEFTREVLGKSVSTVRAYWQQRLFSGAEVPPPEKASEDDALQFVRSHPAGLTYVAPDVALPNGVRALAVGE
jgi:ABC-type phosphate transport system substrate-binding protein